MCMDSLFLRFLLLLQRFLYYRGLFLYPCLFAGLQNEIIVLIWTSLLIAINVIWLLQSILSPTRVIYHLIYHLVSVP